MRPPISPDLISFTMVMSIPIPSLCPSKKNMALFLLLTQYRKCWRIVLFFRLTADGFDSSSGPGNSHFVMRPSHELTRIG
ncbi:unnamed protein product [Linum trigynum]|uniref:Uncharacterized protein n=1 Tax=Linum trigynum TaxID=586398 RepID=A0AAV2ECQ9_9ROSI